MTIKTAIKVVPEQNSETKRGVEEKVTAGDPPTQQGGALHPLVDTLPRVQARRQEALSLPFHRFGTRSFQPRSLRSTFLQLKSLTFSPGMMLANVDHPHPSSQIRVG